MKAHIGNQELDYKSDKNGDISFTFEGNHYFTQGQPSFDNHPENMTYSQTLYTCDEDFGICSAGRIVYDVRLLDNEEDPEGVGVWATSVLDDESDVCDWTQFTVQLDC